jgi:hypothetical protein
METKKALALHRRLMKKHSYSKSHPVIEGDPALHRCGCSSLESLQKWFAEFWNALHHAGYVVRVYKAAIDISTAQQLIYFESTAEEVETIPMLRRA